MLVKIWVIFARKVSAKDKEERDCYCRYHVACTGHTIQKCEDFKKLLQAMMDQREIEFSKEGIEKSVNLITDAKFVGGFFF